MHYIITHDIVCSSVLHPEMSVNPNYKKRERYKDIFLPEHSVFLSRFRDNSLSSVEVN